MTQLLYALIFTWSGSAIALLLCRKYLAAGIVAAFALVAGLLWWRLPGP